jgi:hypothetical protein
MGLLIRLLGMGTTATYLAIVVFDYHYARRPLDMIDLLAIGIALVGSLIFVLAEIIGEPSRKPKASRTAGN